MPSGEAPIFWSTDSIEPNRVYRFSEVCELLQIHDSTLRRWLKLGRIRGSRFGREWRFLGSHLIESLNRAVK